MMIDETAGDEQGRKEMKVKIPVEQHVQLHTLKTLTGQNISTTVTEAVQDYLEEKEVLDGDQRENGDG